ncbi:MAG: glutathionylspermidine synthase family protein [Alphaproteobacteria bacterium]
MHRVAVQPRPDWRAKVEALGFNYHTMYGQEYWVEDHCYVFSAAQIDALDDATNELHQMCLKAVDRVVREKLYHRLAIPDDAVPYIETTWNRQDPEVYGRFDIAYDGVNPPKMLEYNADTPTALLETSVVQWYWLKDMKPEADQFNSVHEKLIDTWKQVGGLLSPGALVHFASVVENQEDFGNTEYMRDVCSQAQLNTVHIDIADIGWNGSRFVDLENRPIQVLFKLYPWEWLAREQFAQHILSDTTAFIEPAWKMILSNKAILPILWEMFPDHPNLLPAYTSPERLGDSYVKKPFLSREGANVTIVTPDRTFGNAGEYGAEGFIYQRYQPLQAFDGFYPVIGSWVIGGKAAGIGVREDANPITDNLSRFLPHYFE